MMMMMLTGQQLQIGGERNGSGMDHDVQRIRKLYEMVM
jgi:hypothetical protein